MARTKQKPIVALDWNSSARSNSNPTPPSALPAPGSNVLLQQPAQPSQTANSISLPDAPSVRQVPQDSPQQPESFPAVFQSSDSRLAPTEKILRCDICNETFPGSHLQPFRDHIEKCHADTNAGLDNDSDEGSPTDRLTTPPESERSETDRIPLPPAYSSTEVQLYPKIHDEDDETEDQQPQQPQQRFRLPALTSISEYQDSLDAGEDGSLEDHARVLVNAHDALVQIQDEYLSLDRAAKTSQYPPTLSLEDEFDMIGGRVRGVLRETIKPSMKVVNPRAKPVRSDDPEKWHPTNQFQLDQDRTEGAVYGYITKEGAKDIGRQDPIGQRARGPGENRDLRARQPMRNTVRDDDSGDESGLNAVDAALLEGGRGKREKRPSNRVIGTNSRASSVDARAKPARKNAKSRLADLGADHPSAAETLDSTNRWVDDVDADDGSGASDDESGVTKPHKGPQQSYLDPKTKKNATGRKSKNVSNNGELDDEEAAAAKAARSQKRSEGAKMGWAKRKEALAAKESTQASVNGDLDEGSQSELAKPEPNDASDAGSNLKVAPKKKVKQMIQLADGTWIEKPSAATINMRRRWQKKREAEAKGLPPPKIGRYKKTGVVLAESSSTPADFNDQENDQLLAAVDGANKRKQSELNNEDDNDADKTTKGRKKPRKNKQELSAAMVLDDDNDTVNDDTLMDEDDESAQPTSAKKKRQAEDDFAGPPRKKISTQRNTESLASSDEEDEVTEEEMLLDASSSPRKRVNNGGRRKKMGKENKKKVGDHAEEERQTRSPFGHNRAGQANQRMGMDATGTSYGEPGFMSFTNSNNTEHQAAASGSATKKYTEGKAPRKSESKDTEADSPVASIENGEEMTSSQKTVVDPEVAEAMRKREEARKAKSEKMKAITKARWASGEMHTVMEKKKANNALKKAALNAGGNAPIAIAPAPLAIALAKAAPTVMGGIGEKVKGQGSVSQSLAPVTSTLGSFSAKGKAKSTAKPESKKEPRTKQLAKSETASSSRRSISRGLSNEMDGANSEDNHDSDEDTGKSRKLTEYEMFLQISTPGAAATSDSDGRPTRARSIAGVYEGRRSGRGGSLGGVGMERNNSDDGTGMMAARGTPASVGGARKGKGVSKMSLYDQFQLLSSPTSAGSPVPRSRRPAALRAKQTFQSFGQDDEMEDEETVAYAGPPVHLGHSRNNSGVSISSSAKKDNGKGKKAMLPPQPKPQQTKVKKEEVELGDEEESEGDSEDDGPKKKSAYDMWQDIINNGGEVPEGEKRKRVAAKKSDVGK